MRELPRGRRVVPAAYYDRRPLDVTAHVQAVCAGVAAGALAYYLARVVLGRAALPRGGALPAAGAGGPGAGRHLSPSTTGTART